MPSKKLSISLTPELASVLDRIARARREDRSRVIEMLLRENPLVLAEVARARGVATGPVNPGTKNGRDMEKLWAIGESARRNWKQAEATGRVRILAR